MGVGGCEIDKRKEIEKAAAAAARSVVTSRLLRNRYEDQINLFIAMYCTENCIF